MANFYASYPPSTAGSGSGITSINGDTTAAQIIAAGSGISVSTVAGTTTVTNTGSGTGTVTSVSVTTANGVSGSVATATTTPAITLTLGAITPTSVAATGSVTGSNLSGTNTGDQTITLTSDVTGSGTGSFATTIAAGAVTNAKIAAAAGISVNKIAALTANRAVASDASGFITPSATTDTELGYVSGVTSAIQTQINGKQATGNYITALTGDVTATGPGSVAATIANLAVTNAKIANATIDLTTKVTGALPIANGGTGQTTANPAFNALSPLTTKGDIVSYSTVNARLPVGTDGQVLTADSAQALGIKWAATNQNVSYTVSSLGSPVTLTNADNRYQAYGLSGNQSVTLPTTGVLQGDYWSIAASNTADLTLKASGGATLRVLNYETLDIVANVNSPTLPGHWYIVRWSDNLGASDWIPYTPTVSAAIVNTGASVFRWRRDADDFLIAGDFTFSGSSGAATFTISVPSPYTIDTSVYPSGSINALGPATYFQSPNIYWGIVGPNSSTTLAFLVSYNIADSGGSRIQPFDNSFPNNGDIMTFNCRVKIVEFS